MYWNLGVLDQWQKWMVLWNYRCDAQVTSGHDRWNFPCLDLNALIKATISTSLKPRLNLVSESPLKVLVWDQCHLAVRLQTTGQNLVKQTILEWMVNALVEIAKYCTGFDGASVLTAVEPTFISLRSLTLLTLRCAVGPSGRWQRTIPS